MIDKKDGLKTLKFRDYFLNNIQKSLPDISINGPIGHNRLANNINISEKIATEFAEFIY